MTPSRYAAAPRARGFTLIELVTVLLVIAILSAVAYASYQSYIIRTNRSKAISALSRAAYEQERFLYTYGRYASRLDGRSNDPASSGLGLPVTTRENGEVNAYYDLSVQLANNNLSYTLRAVPRGRLQSRDACGTLVLSSTGDRSADRSGCW